MVLLLLAIDRMIEMFSARLSQFIVIVSSLYLFEECRPELNVVELLASTLE